MSVEKYLNNDNNFKVAVAVKAMVKNKFSAFKKEAGCEKSSKIVLKDDRMKADKKFLKNLKGSLVALHTCDDSMRYEH